MSIPGHAPRPKTPPDPDRRLLAPGHRDAGLDRVGQVTKWTVVGGLALTGGFAVVAAGTQPGHTRTPTVPSSVTVPGPTSGPTTAAGPTATTPPTTAANPGANTAETTPPTTAPPLTAPPLTAPPQPAYTPPANTPAPPVVTSGAS